ncbi:hypothetical protein [Ascidiimonas sp. W6]|uniref:hypothetical protein n=1 Tax=Ascidiimonas meishanensis TaxID=3128903 RepID=UPI0030EE7D40
MKRIFIIFALIVLTSACSDGDLQVETIDFTSISIDSCSGDTSLYFKISGDEAIILEAAENLIINEVTDTEDPRSSAIPGNSQFSYRFFSDNVNNAYFCSSLPPATPVVNDELEATAGTVFVTTVEITENEITRYEHTINIEGLVLLNSNGERIIDTDFEFGTITTTTD